VAGVAARELATWPRGVPFALHPRLRSPSRCSAMARAAEPGCAFCSGGQT
jgi:hypothetical protein